MKSNFDACYLKIRFWDFSLDFTERVTFSRGTIFILHCLNPPRHEIHQSWTGCCWHPLPLLHNDITELLDVRHMVLLQLPHEDAPHVLNRVQVWRHSWPLHHLQQGSCHLGAVFWVVMLESIIFCFRMSQHILESSMNRSSPVPAVAMQTQTMNLPPCLTVGKAQFSWYSSLAHRQTCWAPSQTSLP